MGLEIRRVPPNWEHPRYTKGDANRPEDVGTYRPCYDESYEDARKKWLAELWLWLDGKHESQENGYSSDYDYWEYSNTPDRESYRPAFTEEPTWFQVYETVSEGCPVTPPFATKEELVVFLYTHKDFWGQGPRSKETAEAFINDGWVPSMVVKDGQVFSDMESAAIK